MTLLLTLHHRNKENEPSSLNGTAPPRRRRSTAMNPYSQPLPFNQNERNARRNSAVKPTFTTTATVKPTSTSTAAVSSSQINEDSPTIKRILATTGYASVEEFLASRNANSSKASAVNGVNSAATNRAMNQAKTAPNDPKAATNGAPNVAKNVTNRAKNGDKSTKGSKTTNPKKKKKSKYFY